MGAALVILGWGGGEMGPPTQSRDAKHGLREKQRRAKKLRT